MIGMAARLLIRIDVLMPVHPHASSSHTTASSTSDAPPPPYSMGMFVLIKPACRAFSITGSGNSAVRS